MLILSLGSVYVVLFLDHFGLVELVKCRKVSFSLLKVFAFHGCGVVVELRKLAKLGPVPVMNL